MKNIEFEFKEKEVKLNGSNTRDLFRKIVDFLFENGYSFDGEYHKTERRKIYTEVEKNEKIQNSSSFNQGSFYDIGNSGRFIFQYLNDPIKFGKKMLQILGCKFPTENIPEMNKLEIEKNIKSLAEASKVVKNCIDNNQFLCDILNKVDKNFLSQFLRSDKTGVVIDIRKEVTKTILLNDITSKELTDIIIKHKKKNTVKLNSWVNPYKILHPLVNKSFEDLDNFMKQFSEFLKTTIGDVKYKICNFDGPQHQGSDNYWIAFYNSKHESQADGLQLFIQFINGKMTYGVYRHIDDKYLVDPVEFVDFDLFSKFIDDNKSFILEEEIRPKMTFIEAAKFILEQNGNNPLTSAEIWHEIHRQRLVSTVGKTPQLSLNSILTNHSVNLEKIAPERKTRRNSEIKNSIFKIESSEPYKFIINNYMPLHIKQNLTQNGFITIDMLRVIFEKNGLKFEI